MYSVHPCLLFSQSDMPNCFGQGHAEVFLSLSLPTLLLRKAYSFPGMTHCESAQHMFCDFPFQYFVGFVCVSSISLVSLLERGFALFHADPGVRCRLVIRMVKG